MSTANGGRFFGLPAELRNRIYNELARVHPTEVCATDEGCAVAIAFYIEPSLLRISKQFKREYKQETYQNAHFMFVVPIWHTRERIHAPIIPPYSFLNISKIECILLMTNWLATKSRHVLDSFEETANRDQKRSIENVTFYIYAFSLP